MFAESLGLARALQAGPSPIRWQSAPGILATGAESVVSKGVYVNMSCAVGVASLAALPAVAAAWVVWGADPASVEALAGLDLAYNTDLTFVCAEREGEATELLDLYKVWKGKHS